MKVVYAQQAFPTEWTRSIFLAGPTPRSASVQSWRGEALALLRARGFDGVVFVPEDESGTFRGEYDDQVTWEREGLRMADVIVFWVARELETMPAFTTNVEFGHWISSGKCVLGHPERAPKTRYLAWLAGEHRAPVHHTLEATLDEAIARTRPVLRAGGERAVPLLVWDTPAFQRWYAAQRAAGNRLDDANLLWHHRTRFSNKVFAWILRVNVWIASEDRHKSSEWVMARTDASSVVLYRRNGPDPMDADVLMVREFRAPVRNRNAMVLELPGGSSDDEDVDPATVAADEAREETGISVDVSRLRSIGARQTFATLASHVVHGYAAELTDEELAHARALVASRAVIDGKGTERTWVELRTAREIFSDTEADWTTVALVAKALL
ncbi:MAG: NUDIX domain-containing protein [Myxococcales bacterium]|nr:NUDIX domain-containing protein [Myxococcales bacterium]